jgi:hypothetical protein
VSIEDKRLEPLLSDLSFVEFENGHLLDDDSIRLIAELRGQNLLSNDEWLQIKQFLKEALAFLSGPDRASTRMRDGQLAIDPDADPRNADWLRIDAACRLSHRALPMWAALWLWRLRTDTSLAFWRRVGRIAGRLGYSEFPPKESV